MLQCEFEKFHNMKGWMETDYLALIWSQFNGQPLIHSSPFKRFSITISIIFWMIDFIHTSQTEKQRGSNFLSSGFQRDFSPIGKDFS